MQSEDAQKAELWTYHSLMRELRRLRLRFGSGCRFYRFGGAAL